MLGTITITVGQRESEDVKEKDRAKEMAASSTVVEDITKDEQEETPEIIEQIPASESNVEEMAQAAESQANDVGFKKVFKFVGFKFTVKKDKNEKSDTVQLLTVKKDEGEGAEASVGAGDHQEPGVETVGESASKESELSKTLVHTVSVAVIDGTRAVTSAEERSPSWISASMTEPLEHAEGVATPPVGEVTEKDITAEATPALAQTLPGGKDAHDDIVTSEVDFTSEAVTAAETTEALRAEELTEASGAEETTDMVSAVSQLSDSPDTTEEATPVQEVEGGMLDTEEQERQTQAVLQAVADKVKEDSQVPATQTLQRAGPKALEKVEEVEEDSEVLATEKEKDVVPEGPVQEAETEHLAQGSETVQATPESLEVPEVTEDVDRATTCQADSQGAQQMLDKDESDLQVSPQDGTLSAVAQEGLAVSDSSEGMSKASEMITTLAVESASVKESVEKLPLQCKDEKEHAADGPQHQSLAKAEADASGNLTKESPDTNGPKLTEEGDALKEEMNKAQTEEDDLQEPKGDLTES